MRKFVNIIALSFVPMFALAQQGGVKIEPKSLEKRGGELFMAVEVVVDRENVNRHQSYIITPELKGENNTYEFKKIIVNGSRKTKMWKRSEKLSGPMVSVADTALVLQKANRKKAKHEANYEVAIPFEKWMLKSKLYVNEIIVACSNCPTGGGEYDTGQGLHLVIPPVYEIKPLVNYMVPEKEAIKRRDIQSQSFLDFPVGKSVIQPNFRRNPVELGKIDETLSAIKSNNDVQVTSMFIEGFASPEGSATANERLSGDRAASLMKYISDKYDIPFSVMRSNGGGEDWKTFHELIRNSDITHKGDVLSIIDNDDALDIKERKLRLMSRGTVYKVLLNDFFPQLRRVDYRVEFNVRAYGDHEVPDVYKRDPSMLSTYELYMLAQHTADAKERDEIMAKNEQLFPDNPATIVNGIARNFEAGKMEEAKRWVEMAGRTPDAFNNIGVVYMMEGNYEAAEGYFKQAVAAGSNEAKQNLSEIEAKRKNDEDRKEYADLIGQ